MASTKEEFPHKVMAELEAEDALFKHLGEMPVELVIPVALMTARLQWSRWGAEESAMIKRNDPRPVYRFNSQEMLWLLQASLRISPDDMTLVYLGQQAGKLLIDITPDAAVMAAYRAARWAVDCFSARAR